MSLENSENPIGAQHSAPDTRSESRDHKDKPDPPIPPAVVRSDPPPPPQKHCEITVNTKRDWIDWWTLRLEGFGLFVLIVYTVFTGLMWCANKKAAEAAKSAADTAKQSLNSVERPYVVFDSIETRKLATLIPIGTNLWQFTPRWQNAGNTPAMPAIHDFFAQSVEGEPTEEQFIGTEKEEYVSFPIGPHAFQSGKTVYTQESDILQARQGLDNRKFFMAWGWLLYRDVFRPSSY